MSLIVKERRIGPITMLELGERLTLEGVAELHEKLQSLVAAGRLSLLLDCSRVTAIDSQGLGILVRHWASVERRGGKLKLVCLSRRMREALELTGLLKVFEAFDDVGLALRSF